MSFVTHVNEEEYESRHDGKSYWRDENKNKTNRDTQVVVFINTNYQYILTLYTKLSFHLKK